MYTEQQSPESQQLEAFRLSLLASLKELDDLEKDWDSLETGQIGGLFFYPSSLILPEIQTKLKALFKKHVSKFSHFTLMIIGLETCWNPEEPQKIAVFFNELQLPHNTYLRLQKREPAVARGQANPSLVQHQQGTQNLKTYLEIFLEHIHHPSIIGFDLSGHDFGTMPLIFLSVLRILTPKTQAIFLQGNRLHLLTLETLECALKMSASSKNHLKIDLLDNELDTFGYPSLFALYEEYGSKMLLSFFSENEHFKINASLAYQELPQDKKLLWAKLYCRSLLIFYNGTPLATLIEKQFIEFNLSLNHQQKIELIYFILEQCKLCKHATNYNHDSIVFQYWFLTQILKAIALESEDLLEFACNIIIHKKIEAEEILCVFVANFGEQDKELNNFLLMNPADRLALFLYICQNDGDPDIYRTMRYFQIFDLANNQASQILSTLKEICVSHPDDTTWLEYEESSDVIEQKLLTTTVPAFEKLFEASSWQNQLLTFIKKYKEEHPGEEGVLPTTNMILWLVWTAAKITFFPGLNTALHSKNAADLENYTPYKMLREILKFAKPQARYSLTATFLKSLCPDPQIPTTLEDLASFKITAGGNTDTLLASIPLVDIVQSEIKAEKRQTLYDQSKTILLLIPFAHAWKPRRSKRRACKPEGGARIFCSAR